jgi:hypothetical protein
VSLVGQRAALAEALSAIDGVRGTKYRPRVPGPGDAWPLLESLDRAEAYDFEASWRVAVILPPDEVRASEWFDEHHESIAEGLEDFGYVDRIEPGLVATEAGDLQAMFLILRREA